MAHSIPRQPNERGRLFFERIAILLGCIAAAIAFLIAWQQDPNRPVGSNPNDGWWSHYDQHRYILSALGFAHADLSPATHWYLPAYPALASLFVRLVPVDPFLIPDLACFLISLLLSVSLGGALAPGWRFGRLAGLLSFLACSVIPPVCLAAWVMPWSSTLAVPLMLGSLRATIWAMDHPDRRLPPFLAGLAGAAVWGCRPVDAALLLASVGLVGAIAVLSARGVRHAALRWLPLFSLGVALGALPNLVLYLLIWGPHESAYMIGSGLIGFEWRLLPLHWVEIMVSPRPLLPGGEGLAQRLPFIGTGLLGLLAALLLRRDDRLRHGLVALSVLGSIGLYLCYRDLHAPGLWQYSNYHYFKWSFALFGYYSLLLVRNAFQAGSRRLLWLVPFAVIAFCWRVQPHAASGTAGRVDGNRLTIVVPPMGVQDAIVVPAMGRTDAIYFGTHRVTIDGRLIAPISHFKALPISGGFVLTPLRPWPGGTLSLQPVDGVQLLNAPAPFRARLSLRFGLPCWFGIHQRGCVVDGLLPPPVLPEGAAVGPNGADAPAIGEGWSSPEPQGRWTLGHAAELRFRTAPADGHAIRITVAGSPFWVAGMPSAIISIGTDRQKEEHHTLRDGSTRTLDLVVPAALRNPDGTVNLWIDAAQPHRPSDVFPGSRDTRPLGFFLRSVRWTELPG